MKTFKLKTLCRQVLSKRGGLQYFGNSHAHVDVTPNVIEKCPCFIQKQISKGYNDEKSCIYRLKNNE